MSALNIEDVKESIYQSLENDNEDIDLYITQLKTVMQETGQKEAIFDSSRLAHNNLAGRKLMHAYFKKRGVKVVFDNNN